MLTSLQVCFNAVAPLFLIMALGYGAKCLGAISVDAVPSLNKLAFRYFMPVMLFRNLYDSSLSHAVQPRLLLFAVAAVLAMYGLSMALVLPTEKDPEKQGVKIQGMYRSNLAIIGLPLAKALVPGADMGPVAMLAAVIVPLFNVLAVITLTVFRGEKLRPARLLRMILTNPLIIGSAVGLLFLAMDWRLPAALEAAVEQVADMTIQNGGPIIMVQVENEYGSYGEDKSYVSQIRDIVRANYPGVALFQCDWASNFTKNGLHDLVWTMNFGTGANIDQQFAPLKKLRPDSPLMCSEFWSGWFDKWGANHETRPAADMIAGIDEMLSKGISFSLYMTHGGTNWGHWAGANSPGFAPDVTSYDYDAPSANRDRPLPNTGNCEKHCPNT